MMVREDLRKKGIGTDLLLDVLIRLREEGFTTFTLQVLPSEAPGFIRLAERFAMKKEESGKLWYTLKLSDAEPLASVKGDRSEICSMKDISREDGFLAMERIEKDFPKQGQRPFSETDLDPELTLLKFDDVGLCAGLFVEKRDGKLYLAYLFNDSDELLTMEGLLSTAWEKAVKEYPGNTPLSVAVMDEKTEELMNRIPKAKKEAVAEYTMDLRILDILTEEDVA